MTTTDLYESLQSLKEETSDYFYAEIKRVKDELPIELYDKELDNLEECLIVDIIDEINGGIYSVYVTKIDEFGAFTGQYLDDSSNIQNYGIYDIANEYNKIELIEILERL